MSGKDEYQIGDRLDIETYYKFPTEKRNNISFQHAIRFSHKISQYSEVISKFYKPSVIAGFYPFRNEINLIPLHTRL